MAKKRATLKNLSVGEISAVTTPAQEGARDVLIKSAIHVEKSSMVLALTAAAEGHSHLITSHDGSEGGWSTGASIPVKGSKESYSRFHSHPWIIDAEGNLVIGEAEGHTHTVAVRKSSEDEEDLRSFLAECIEKLAPPEGDAQPSEEDMADATKDLEKRLETADALAKRGAAIASMTAEQFAVWKGLSGPDADEYLGAGSAARVEIAKRLEAADPVLYTTSDKVEIRKSHGDIALAMAKGRDEDRAATRALVEKALRTDLEKRAGDDLSHFRGTVDERCALLKAVDGIVDADQRAKVLDVLKAANASMAGLFTNRGTSEGVEKGTAQQEFDRLVEKHASENKVGIPAATEAVLKTKEGMAAYAATF